MAEIILTGDALEQLRKLPPESVHTCVTSPPYYNLRDYGAAGQIGNEASVEEYLQSLVSVFREVRRVLRADGTLWVNMGDSYATRSGNQPPTNTRNSCGHTAKHTPRGYKYKDLIGVPWQLAFALRADGWYLRQDIIWNKSNCMPESVRDRCTKSHEYIFLLSKAERYYFDAAAISEFNEEMRTMHARDFLENRLIAGLNARHVVAGYDHRFGYLGECGTDMLSALCAELHIGLTVVGPVRLDGGEVISSTAIRRAIREGDYALAERMLGRPCPEAMRRRDGK